MESRCLSVISLTITRYDNHSKKSSDCKLKFMKSGQKISEKTVKVYLIIKIIYRTNLETVKKLYEKKWKFSVRKLCNYVAIITDSVL